MKRKIRINVEQRVAYIPKDIFEQGFSGDIDGYANAVTLTLVNPKTPLSQVEQSLEIVLADIRMRRTMEKKERKRTRDET